MNIEHLPSLTGAFRYAPQVTKLYHLERTQKGSFQYLSDFGIEFNLIFDAERRFNIESFASHLTERMAAARLNYISIGYIPENKPENQIEVIVNKGR